MTAATRARIPQHLDKYIVEQDYARYTPEDQAVWRYIMRQLESFLTIHAHASYREGLRQTGLEIECIPRIDQIDAQLEKFGWGAVPVSGFIPPAAFMEFQSIGVLPIASDMRTINHLLYTPAPDIVHEAAGHAPILVDEEYASYLKQYGDVARHAILSREDMQQYEAIRILSDLKEDSRSTAAEILRAEQHLREINSSIKQISEAALLSRMNWWTAEYGLIGELEDPKIYGAGLLSSVGESRAYLNSNVKKIPLSVDCVNYAYDITEMQPQLFVARDFSHLATVLEELATRLSYRRGGVFGLGCALEAATPNTVQLNSGLQISGILQEFGTESECAAAPAYLRFCGPCQLAFAYHELPGQGVRQHAQGFSTPVGRLKNHRRCLSSYSANDLVNLALNQGQRSRLEFESGVRIEGLFVGSVYMDTKLVLLTWHDCSVTWGEKTLFEPSWGVFDMAVGSEVTSVFGGPADRTRYGQTEDFTARRVPLKSFSEAQVQRHDFFRRLSAARATSNLTHFRELTQEFLSSTTCDWLQGVELLELSFQLGLAEQDRAPLLTYLNGLRLDSVEAQGCLRAGVARAGVGT